MHFLILDTNNLLCRAYFVGDKIYTSDGTPIGAIAAMATYIQSLIRLLGPTHIVMTRDMGGPTWRHKMYPDYKKNRTKADEELYKQFPLVPALAAYLEIPLLGHHDFEADDCIATLTKQAEGLATTTIVTSDKDLCQLINDKVRIYNTHSKLILDQGKVEIKYGIPLNRLIDYFTLIGDGSDNLPGVKGIGPKTAVEIINKCSDINCLDTHLHHFKPAVQKKITNQNERINLMRTLFTLSDNIELDAVFSEDTHELFKVKGFKNTTVDKIKELYEKTST